MTPSLILTALAAIAVYRGSRFLTGDKVGQPFRDWAKAKSPWLEYLSTCDWCVSTYLGIPFAILITWHTDRIDDTRTGVELALWFVVTWLTLSGVTGLLSTCEQAIDNRSRRDIADAKMIETSLEALNDERR